MSQLSVVGVSPRAAAAGTNSTEERAKTLHDWGMLHGLGVRPPHKDTVELARKLAGDVPSPQSPDTVKKPEGWTEYFKRVVVAPLNPYNWSVPKAVKEQMDAQKAPYVLVAVGSLVPWAARLGVPGAAALSAVAQNVGHVAKVCLLNGPGNFLTHAVSEASNRASLLSTDKHVMGQMYTAGLHVGELAHKTSLFQRTMDVVANTLPALVTSTFSWMTMKFQARHEANMLADRILHMRLDNLRNN